MDIGLSYNPLDVAYATRTIPLGQFWMTGGAALPTGRTTIEDAIDRLKIQRLLVDGKFTDPHKAALILVRRLLEGGASQHVAYEDMEDQRKLRFYRKPDGAAARSQSVSTYTPGRNSPCPCGSGKRYKRCCGAKA
jgi:SEC-C motif